MDYYFTTYYEGNYHYTRELHRAGTIAYITEMIITAACIVWVALTLVRP